MSMLRDVVNKIDGSSEQEAIVKEALQELILLADTKSQVMSQKIEADLLTGKTIDGLTIPITNVIGKKIEFRAVSSEGTAAGDLVKKITSSISGMFSGEQKILEGLGGILADGLEALMGCAEGEESKMEQYFVVAEYPAIVRYDFSFWERKVSSAGIQKHMKDALACVAYKSSVDVTKLSFNSFLSFYGPVLNTAYPDGKKKIKSFLVEAKEIYELLLGTDKKAVANIDIDQKTIDVVNSDEEIKPALYTPIVPTKEL